MVVRQDVRFIDRMSRDMDLFFRLYNFRVREMEWSTARVTYFEHAQALFAEQGFSYDDVEGVFDAVDLVLHPDDDDD